MASLQELIFLVVIVIVLVLFVIYGHNIIFHGGRPLFDERDITSNSIPSFMKVPEGRFMVQSSIGNSFLIKDGYEEDLYEPFNSYDKWGDKIMGIYDQGKCGSCWSFSATSSFSDRLRIQNKSEVSKNIHISPYEAAGCIKCAYSIKNGKWVKTSNHNTECPSVCEGNYMDDVLQYFVEVGGIPDNFINKVQKYVCSHIDNKMRAKRKYKVSKYNITNLGKNPEKYKANELAIMEEIKNNGPVCSIIIVLNPSNEPTYNFYRYKSGVYGANWTHVPEQNDGFHAINIIGWGSEEVGGAMQKYWLCRNSWGDKHGINGFFKIIRGRNFCFVECDVWALDCS